MSHTRNKSNDVPNRTATAYVLTFDPIEGKGAGHTSLYVEGSDGTHFERSFFPSGRYYAATIHHLSLHTVPVYGFLTRGIEQDVQFQNAPPSYIHKIDNLDYEAMVKENEDFRARVKTGDHGFSMSYSNYIPFNSFYFLKGAWKEQKNFQERTGFYPAEEPISGVVMTSDEDTPTISLGNCTEAVERSLKAGGLKINYKYNNFFSNRNKLPKNLKKTLDANHVNDVRYLSEYPENIRAAIQDGELRLKNRNLEEEKKQIEEITSFSRGMK